VPRMGKHRRIGRIAVTVIGVDGAVLCGVAGLGVAEFEILGHVLGWEPDSAVPAGEGNAAIGVDCGDRPMVAVLDHQSPFGAECPVVAPSDHLVPHQHPPIASPAAAEKPQDK